VYAQLDNNNFFFPIYIFKKLINLEGYSLRFQYT